MGSTCLKFVCLTLVLCTFSLPSFAGETAGRGGRTIQKSKSKKRTILAPEMATVGGTPTEAAAAGVDAPASGASNFGSFSNGFSNLSGSVTQFLGGINLTMSPNNVPAQVPNIDPTRVAPVPVMRRNANPGTTATTTPTTVPTVNQDVMTGIVLNGTYILREGKGQGTRRLGLMNEFTSTGVTITDSDDARWFKVTTSTGQVGYVNRMALNPTRIQGDYFVRRAPNKDSGEKLGMVRDLRSDKDLILTGRTNGSGTDKWVEVVFNGEPGWVHSGALMDGELPAPATSTPSVTRPAAPAAPAAADPEPAPVPQEECVTANRSSMQRNPRFRFLLDGPNLFTSWKTFGGTIIVREEGPAVLQVMFKEDTTMPISICLNPQNIPYLSVMGNQIFFNDGEKRGKISVPYDGKVYEFTREGVR